MSGHSRNGGLIFGVGLYSGGGLIFGILRYLSFSFMLHIKPGAWDMGGGEQYFDKCLSTLLPHLYFCLLTFFSIMLFFPTPTPPINLPYPSIPLPYPSLLSCLILSTVVKLQCPCPPIKTFLFCPVLKCTPLPFVKTSLSSLI